MVSRIASGLGCVAVVAIVVGLSGCTSADAENGKLILRVAGLPGIGSVRFSVTGSGVELPDVRPGRVVVLSKGKYEVSASAVRLHGTSYLPTKAGVATRAVITHITVRAGRTFYLTERYVRQATKGELVQLWRQVNSDSPFASSFSLDQLACASSSHCLAIGGPRGGDLYQSIWDGNAWSTAAETGLADTEVNSLACPTERYCVMGTGSVQIAEPAFIDVWDGSNWNSQSPVAGAETYSVSCPSISFCMGVAQEGSAAAVAVVVRRALGAWTAIATPTWSSNWQVDNVACPSATFCVLASSQRSDEGSSPSSDLVSIWQSGIWHAQESLRTDANWVGCVTATYCLLFAKQMTGVQSSGESMDVYAAWSGSGWNEVVASPASDQADYLYLGDLATPQCALKDSCYETGTLGSTATELAATELLAWSGSSWAVVTTVDQGGSAGQVACSAVGFCLETGPGGTYANS